MLLDRLLKFLKENKPIYGNLVVKTENVPPHISSSNVFDGSCQQKSDDGIAFGNIADHQWIGKDIRSNILILIMIKVKLRKPQVFLTNIVLFLMKHVRYLL